MSRAKKHHRQFSTYEMELQVSYRVCAEILKKSIFCREAVGNTRDIAEVVSMEGGGSA